MKIGFIGLGIMGAPMAGHLIKAGHEVYLKTRREVPANLVEAGGIACATAKGVAEKSDVVITMVPDTPDVELVLFGDDGVAEGLSRGKLVIDMSSISPAATRDFATRLADLGCDYLDAPVSGGEAGAKNAALSIMVGGKAEIFDKAKPIFESLGKAIIHVGSANGDGQVAKCANQIVVALTIQAVAEGLIYASKAGADVEAVRQAILGGLGTSRILDSHGERMIKRTMNPGFRIRLHQKDLNNALESAREMELALPATALAQQVFTAAAAGGAADLDHSALVKGLEQMSAHEIGKK